MIAFPKSASTLSKTGSPKPIGTPVTLISIIAPTDEPSFLIRERYFSHFGTLFLSGQKKSFFGISTPRPILKIYFMISNLG